MAREEGGMPIVTFTGETLSSTQFVSYSLKTMVQRSHA